MSMKRFEVEMRFTGTVIVELPADQVADSDHPDIIAEAAFEQIERDCLEGLQVTDFWEVDGAGKPLEAA